MCEARRAEYVRLLDEEGMNFTQAAHAVGVSKRTGKAWRNGRTRATGRNEKPLVDWYRSTMDKPKTLHPRYLSQEERIQIADRLRLGDSIRAIARLLGRDPGTVSREVERNRNPESGGYEPYRAQQKAADRLKRPKPVFRQVGVSCLVMYFFRVGGGAVFLDCDPRRRRPWRSTRGNSGNARSSCM